MKAREKVMNKTKKGLLIAGSIIFIIEVCMLIGLGILFISARGFLDSKLIEEILIEEEIAYTANDINNILDFGKSASVAIGVVMILSAIAMGAVSILLLNKTKKNIYSKGLNITLLVFSIFIGDMLVMAFMIAGLVIKDKTPTFENIKEIGEQHNITQENIEDKIEEIKEDKE